MFRKKMMSLWDFFVPLHHQRQPHKRMQRLLITWILLLTAINSCWAQSRSTKVRNKECPSYIYRVTLRDKQNSPTLLTVLPVFSQDAP